MGRGFIDYRKWALNTSRAVPASELRAELERAKAEYLSTNTPAILGADNLWSVDVPLRDAVVRQIDAGIVSAMAMAEAIAGTDYVQASLIGHVMRDRPDGVDERVMVSVDQVAPLTFAEHRQRMSETEAAVHTAIEPMEHVDPIVAAIEAAQRRTSSSRDFG